MNQLTYNRQERENSKQQRLIKNSLCLKGIDVPFFIARALKESFVQTFANVKTLGVCKINIYRDQKTQFELTQKILNEVPDDIKLDDFKIEYWHQGCRIYCKDILLREFFDILDEPFEEREAVKSGRFTEEDSSELFKLFAMNDCEWIISILEYRNIKVL